MIENSILAAVFTGFDDWLRVNATEVDWGVYDPKVSLEDKRTGAFALQAIPQIVKGSLRGLNYDYKIHIRVEDRATSEFLLLQKLYNIQFYIEELILKKLRINGISGIYLDIALNRALQGISTDKIPIVGMQGKQGNYHCGVVDLFFIQYH